MEQVIEANFANIGARARVSVVRRQSWGAGFNLNVLRDGIGEYFLIERSQGARMAALDGDTADRHLLLEVRFEQRPKEPHVYLCGHDERAWFAAAIPEEADARTIQQAKDALKPREVWDAMREFGVPMDQRDSRRTAAFVRQGEWFFIPYPLMQVPQHLVLRNEPIQRGRGRAHICQFLHRTAGQEVYVNDENPNGITAAQFRGLSRHRRAGHWERRYRDALVYVRGSIRHPDHQTITLRDWHHVVPNTEHKAQAMTNLAFLD